MMNFVKKFSTLLCLVAIQSATAANIIFEEEVTITKKKTVIIEGGMSIGFGGFEHVRPRRKMKAGTVRIGSDVITSDNRSGVVKAIFLNDSKIVVEDRYYGNRTWLLDKIAVTQGCIGAYCVSDSVITSDNRVGTIVGYFNNGQIVVYDRYYGNRTWNQDKVGLAFGCTSVYCKGDSVITSDNRHGVIVGFFNNGQVVVYDRYYGNRTWNSDAIALTEAVCTNIFIQRARYCH